MSTSSKTGVIAIALGDPAGVGPEVALKAVASELNADAARYLLIGDEALVQSLNQQLGLRLDIRAKAEAGSRISVVNPLPEVAPHSSPFTPRSAEAARAALAWLKHGAEFCLRGEADALVTAPVNKPFEDLVAFLELA